MDPFNGPLVLLQRGIAGDGFTVPGHGQISLQTNQANSADAEVMESVLACAHGVFWSTYEVYLAIGTAHGVHRAQFHIKRSV